MTERDDGHDDRDLRRHFEALRAADAELDPGYGKLRPAASRVASSRARHLLRGATLAAGAMAAGLAVWLIALEAPDPTPRHAVAVRIAPGQWSMPSDVLLDLSGLPGDALLRDPPVVGGARPFDLEATPTGSRMPPITNRRPLA